MKNLSLYNYFILYVNCFLFKVISKSLLKFDTENFFCYNYNVNIKYLFLFCVIELCSFVGLLRLMTEGRIYLLPIPMINSHEVPSFKKL